MKTQRIADILKSERTDADVTAQGWVRTKRGNKNVAFLALNDGSCVANLQIVVDLAKIGEDQVGRYYEAKQIIHSRCEDKR